MYSFMLNFSDLTNSVKHMNLSEYIKTQGHGAIATLAEAIGGHGPDVSSWSSGARAVPISRCCAIEQATNGAVTRRELRPDDWQQIWPELANDD